MNSKLDATLVDRYLMAFNFKVLCSTKDFPLSLPVDTSVIPSDCGSLEVYFPNSEL